MQGRVIPDRTDKLQVFPDKWAHELSLVKKMGFDYIELLDDKEGKLRSLLANDPKKVIWCNFKCWFEL